MSVYVICETVCMDEGSIIEAAKEMGFSKGHGLQVGAQKVVIPSDIRNSAYDAQIVIAAKAAGTTYPIAFVKKDGSFMMIIAGQDRMTATAQRFLSRKHGGTGEFIQTYAKQRVIKVAKSSFGHRISSCQSVGETIRMRVTC